MAFKTPMLTTFVVAATVTAGAPCAAQDDRAAGLFTEARQLPLVSQSVVVRICGGEARVQLTQVFANPGPELAQADYRLHLPREAVVTGFGFWHEGRFLAATLKERDRARSEHSAAATTGRATGLLEREGSIHSFSVYPVIGGGLQEVEATIVLPVTTERGRSHVRLPLDSFLGHATLKTSVVAHVETAEALREIGVTGARAMEKTRRAQDAELVFATEHPVEIWWAAEVPPLLAEAESVSLDDGSSAIQLRLALNDPRAGGRGPSQIVLLIDTSLSMRRRGDALTRLVDRILDQASVPVRILAVGGAVRQVVADDRPTIGHRLRSGDAGFGSHWETIEAAAADVGCGTPETRCVVVTDPQIPGLPAERELETIFLADADELVHFNAIVRRSAPVYQPGIEPAATLDALADELVLPVLELESIRQDGDELSPVGAPRRRVAAGGLMRVFFAGRSSQPLTIGLAVDGRPFEREVVIEPLDPVSRRGLGVRRGFYRGRLDDWMGEYRRTRHPELRGRIVELSLREEIPTALTSLHVAAPGRTMARTATAAPLVRRLGLGLLLVGAAVLALSRRWTP
jgi:hypothetical protein